MGQNYHPYLQSSVLRLAHVTTERKQDDVEEEEEEQRGGEEDGIDNNTSVTGFTGDSGRERS